MLNSTERECVTKFLTYHSRDFYAVCLENGCMSQRINNKIEKHKTEINKFRATPLTAKEQSVLAGFLRRKLSEFSAWLKTYNLTEKAFFNALKGMVKA